MMQNSFMNLIELVFRIRGEIPRTTRTDSNFPCFKQQDIPFLEIDIEILITLHEAETLRLADLEGLLQRKVGEMMNISKSIIFQYIEEAYQQTIKIVVHGLASNQIFFFHLEKSGYTWPFPDDIICDQKSENCEFNGVHPNFHLRSESNSVFNINFI